MKPLLVTLSILALSACGKAGTEPVAVPNPQVSPDGDNAGYSGLPPNPPIAAIPNRIIFFGDSFTAAPDGYAYDVATQLGMTIDDRAVGGTELTDPAQYPAILSYPFVDGDTVVMMVGYNDVFLNHAYATHLARFKAELIDALNHLASLNIQTYLGTPTRLIPTSAAAHGVPLSQTTLYRDTILAAYEAVGSPNNIHIVDTYGQYLPDSSMLQIDGIHPGPTGNVVLTGIFVNAINH